MGRHQLTPRTDAGAQSQRGREAALGCPLVASGPPARVPSLRRAGPGLPVSLTPQGVTFADLSQAMYLVPTQPGAAAGEKGPSGWGGDALRLRGLSGGQPGASRTAGTAKGRVVSFVVASGHGDADGGRGRAPGLRLWPRRPLRMVPPGYAVPGTRPALPWLQSGPACSSSSLCPSRVAVSPCGLCALYPIYPVPSLLPPLQFIRFLHYSVLPLPPFAF